MTLLQVIQLFFSMANLLAKFRIDFSDMIIIPDMAKRAKESSKKEFDKLISDFKIDDNEDIEKEDEGNIMCFFQCRNIIKIYTKLKIEI